jgi:hypothetical protein
MCGMFTDVSVSEQIDLPHFPEEIDRSNMSWQSKQGLDVYGGPYRITADGRLEQKQTSYRDKTADEKQQEAQKWGFDSWDAYVQAYDEHEFDEDMVPPSVDWDPDEDGFDDMPPTFGKPREETVDETWWGDTSFHGTFEFHQIIREDPIEFETMEDFTGNNESWESVERPSEYALNVYLEYEARFTRGDLDEIVFMGKRGSGSDDPVASAIEEIEEWQEWKEENDQ